VFPAGTSTSSLQSGSVYDVTRAASVGYCYQDVGTTVTCVINTGPTVNGGDVVSVTVNGVANRTSVGSSSTTVSTSSDTAGVAAALSLTAPHAVGALSASPGTTAAGALTSWVVGFTTSATGALVGNAGSTLTVTFPATASLVGFQSGTVYDSTSSQTVSSYCSPSGLSVVCTLYGSYTVAAGDVLAVTSNGVTNPTTTGAGSLTVVTSSDTSVKTVATSTTAAHGVTGLSAPPSSVAAGALTAWTFGFTTSATGTLSEAAGSAINVTFPPGTTFPDFQGGTVYDNTTSTTVGYCTTSTGTGVTCPSYYNYGGYTINAGDSVTVTIDGVTNPTTTGPATVSVSTTSDTTPVTTTATITTPHAVTGLSASSTSTAAGAVVGWTIGFSASATGALVGAAGSSVSVTLPAGTAFDSLNGATLYDSTTAQTVGSYSSVAGTVVTITLYNGYTVDAGDALVLTVTGVTNPTATGSGSVSVSTSSDTAAVTVPTATTAVQSVSGLSVVPDSTGTTAYTNYTVGFTTSSSGGLGAGYASSVSVILPAGTTFGEFEGGTLTDVTTSTSIGSCNATTGTTVTCTLYSSSYSTAAGDALSATLTGVNNPTVATLAHISVSTSSDTVPVTAAVTYTPFSRIVCAKVAGSASKGLGGLIPSPTTG